MSFTPQQYADLSDQSYKTPEKNSTVNLNGQEYKVLEVVDDTKTGYQGAIYQRVDTGEIVVAHRGTEFTLQDISADAQMASISHNPQITPALYLTELAIELAKDYAIENNVAEPEVTVTGHSLGGALAQVCAYEYGLKSETFNAYGAVGLRYVDLQGHNKEVPFEANERVVNHVMAGDVVSAANHHFGTEVVYAREQEIDSLKYWDYGDGKSYNNDMWRAAAMQMTKYGAHGMANFTNDGSPSILSYPEARELAVREAETISEYRREICSTAGGVRAIGGTIFDVYDFIKDKVIEGVNTIERGIDAGIDILKDGIDFIQNGLDTAYDVIQGGVNVVREGVDAIKDGFDSIKEGGRAIWNYLFSDKSNDTLEKEREKAVHGLQEKYQGKEPQVEHGTNISITININNAPGKMLDAYKNGDMSMFYQQLSTLANTEAGQNLEKQGQIQAQQMLDEQQQRDRAAQDQERSHSVMKMA